MERYIHDLNATAFTERHFPVLICYSSLQKFDNMKLNGAVNYC